MYWLGKNDLYQWPNIQQCLQKTPQQPINPHSQRLLVEQKKKTPAAKGKAKAKVAPAKPSSKQAKAKATPKPDTIYNVERKRYFQQPLERRILDNQHGFVRQLYLCARLDDQFGPIFNKKEKQARPGS